MSEPNSKTILVADDESHVRDLLCELSEFLGYRTIDAKDGLDALMHVESGAPDLVISDIYMPVMNGLQLLHKIRRINLVLPVILITGCTNQKQMIPDLESGLNAYVEKPFRLAEIADKIQALIG
jgi:two-component system OmpR family response regulator